MARSLETYQAKRDFEKTPEPQAGERAIRGLVGDKRFFCVQKHLASHLHYDFRLEHAGALLSWAVPKGPSLRPRDKRLAMMTEDHPLDYGDFEGVIPSGYGAGIVMLWDYGTWQPADESLDVDAALKRGQIKFRLGGYKLKGSWVLVRTRGPRAAPRLPMADGDPQAQRSWLLIKHRDEWAGDLDIAEFAPRSVKSDGDLADILAADDPRIWETDRPVKGGATGKLLQQVIEQAAKIRLDRQGALHSRR